MYSKYLVTYFDVLGFSDLIRKKQGSDIQRLLKIFTRQSKNEPEYAKEFGIKYATFSDLVVRATQIDSTTNLKKPHGILFHELLNLVHVQADLMSHGILIRGAMTVGELFIDDTFVFGPSLIQAYTLESKMAVYPRIIIDPVVFAEFEATDLLKWADHDHETEREHICELVRKDADGVWYVDYLSAIADECEGDGYFDLINRHREVIVDNFPTLNSLDSIAAKYLWLANYHNRCVNNMLGNVAMGNAPGSEDNPGLTRLRIDLSEMQSNYDFPNVSPARSKSQFDPLEGI